MSETRHCAMRRLPWVLNALAATCLSLSAHAQTPSANPLERGPAPTAASLESLEGTYTVGSVVVPKQSAFGGGTVYFPTSGPSGESYGLVAVAPGFIETQSTNTTLAKKWAANGFVVITINVKDLFEYPTPRATELKAALAYVVAQAAKVGTPYAGKVDASRQSVAGHSMGGGGTLEVARDMPGLKAALPLAPWDLQKDFSKVTVPTMIISCEKDIIAPNNTHSETFYQSIPGSTPKARVDLAGEDHFCVTASNKKPNSKLVMKYSTAWLKRFVDNDTRFSAFLCGAPHQADLGAGTLLSGYQENCPY